MAYILRLTPKPGARIPGDRTLYIERFDRDAHAGSGMIYSTNEAHSALSFRTEQEALAFWEEAGKNLPLYTVEVQEAEESRRQGELVR